MEQINVAKLDLERGMMTVLRAFVVMRGRRRSKTNFDCVFTIHYGKCAFCYAEYFGRNIKRYFYTGHTIACLVD
jgi:hypothetical protein